MKRFLLPQTFSDEISSSLSWRGGRMIESTTIHCGKAENFGVDSIHKKTG